MTGGSNELIGGLAAVFAHPDDESFGCAGRPALAHDAGRVDAPPGRDARRSGVPEGPRSTGDFGDVRERELVRAAQVIGLDEVTHPGGLRGRRAGRGSVCPARR